MRFLAPALLAAATVTTANAATVTIVDVDAKPGYVSSITYDDDIVAAQRGRGNFRHIAENVFGPADGNFFEIGLNGHVDFHFNPGFISGGTVYEVTFNARKAWPEFATVMVGNKDDEESFIQIDNNPINNQSASYAFTFQGGPFDTIRLKNAEGSRVSTCSYLDVTYRCGGYDVDAISVVAVPLPASGLVLAAGLGGLFAMRRRRRLG